MIDHVHSFFRFIGAQAQWHIGRLGLHSPVVRHVQRLDKQLILAGLSEQFSGLGVFGIQMAATFLLPVLFGTLLYWSTLFPYLFEGPRQFVVYGLLVLGGFLFPMLNLRERTAERQRRVALDLPDTLDLLTISVEAGLDFVSAMRQVVAKHRPGPLRTELERFFKQVELGRPRRDALREIADRIELSDLNGVVSGLIQADRLGSSLGPILRAQSDSLRARRSQRAEKAAQEAPVKMLAPLMVCILPSVFIVILGPMILQMIRDVSR